MKKAHLLSEEVLYYIKDEWDDSVSRLGYGVWLTTRAIQKKLQDRGIITTWPTLNLRLLELSKNELVSYVRTSAGICWKPSDKNEVKYRD